MSDFSDQLEQLIRDKAAAAADLASRAVYELLHATVPYSTGELQESLFIDDEVHDEDGVFMRTVGATAPQASWTDEGTSPHSIDPLGPWPLHWVDAFGEHVFARHVDHPGTQGTFWFTNATSNEAWGEQLQFAFDLV